MQYDINQINKAIVETLAELLYGQSQTSAKSAEGAIAIFFMQAADWTAEKAAKEQLSEGFVYPWRADMDSIGEMCNSIAATIRNYSSCRGGHRRLIQKIVELSEELMAKFRQERDAGTYRHNAGYIRELDGSNDWGKWMLALRAEFIKEPTST